MKRTSGQTAESKWATDVIPFVSLKQLIIKGFCLRPGVDYIDREQPDLRPPSLQPGEWKDEQTGVFYGVGPDTKFMITQFVDNFCCVCPLWRQEAENLRKDKYFALLLAYNPEPFLFSKLWWPDQPLRPVPWEEITDEQRQWYPFHSHIVEIFY
jgi:hypothetical protein